MTAIVPPGTLDVKEHVGELARCAVLFRLVLPLWLRHEQGDFGDLFFVQSAGNVIPWGEGYDGYGGSADS